MSNREAFERQMKGTFGMLVDLRAREGTGFSYMDWGTQVAWVMWQARVPEGYVIVHKEPSAELVNHGHQVFLGHFNEGGQTGGRSLYFAYKAMIEAVEK